MTPQHWTHWVAVGFGSGLAPKAPGTFGTLAALPLVAYLHWLLPFAFYFLFVAGLFGLAVYCAQRTQQDWHCHDPGRIVIDEWVGLAVALIALPAQFGIWCAAFVIFRFFDIVKPWPIRWLDAQVKGGLGNVLDDVVAGLFSCACLHLLWAFL